MKAEVAAGQVRIEELPAGKREGHLKLLTGASQRAYACLGLVDQADPCEPYSPARTSVSP